MDFIVMILCGQSTHRIHGETSQLNRHRSQTHASNRFLWIHKQCIVLHKKGPIYQHDYNAQKQVVLEYKS